MLITKNIHIKNIHIYIQKNNMLTQLSLYYSLYLFYRVSTDGSEEQSSMKRQHIFGNLQERLRTHARRAANVCGVQAVGRWDICAFWTPVFALFYSVFFFHCANCVLVCARHLHTHCEHFCVVI